MIGSAAIIFLFLLCSMGVFNFFTAIRLEDFDGYPSISSETVSILIPARNEEQNLPKLLQSLTHSSFHPKEILVLDDQSEDRTYEVAQRTLSEGKIPFRVIRGRAWNLSSGLTGKNHACQQLAELASGEILLFCDADVVVSQQAVGRTVSVLNQYPQASGVTGFPSQNAIGIREKLVLPWVVQIPIVLSVPLAWSWRMPFVSLQIANGQWIAIRKKAYEKLGGHRALGSEVLDDVVLARKFAKMKCAPIIPVVAAHDIRVTMYSSWAGLVEGFSKNLIPLFGGTIPRFLILLVWMNFLFFSPIWLLVLNWQAAVLSFCLILICRVVTARVFRAPIWDAVSHFKSIIFLDFLAAKIIYKNLTQQVSWKGRRLNSGSDEAS